MALNVDLQMPEFAEALYTDFPEKVFYGGRGGGKSYAVADYFLTEGIHKEHKFLCCREFQNSMSDSVLSLLESRMKAIGVQDFYEVQRDRILGENGTEFLFKGIRNNVDNIKSIPNISKCWVEEAQSISINSLNTLFPTIREEGSEIIFTFNPRFTTDPVYDKYITHQEDNPQAIVTKVNYNDNPYFTSVLERQRLQMLKTDPALYMHVWEGGCIHHTDAQIYKNKFTVKDFTPDPATWGFPYYGLDFGFSQSSTAFVKLWVYDNCIWIEKEAVKLHLDLDFTAEYILNRIPEARNSVILADSARPESISYLSRHGLQLIEPVHKGKNSVEDGIAFMRSFNQIYINSSCENTIRDFTMYSYKVNPTTNDVTNIVEHKNDHTCDAARYAVNKLMRMTQNPLLFAF